MSFTILQERLTWFDLQVRNGQYPNSRKFADKFEISRRTAKRMIESMIDRMGAPLEYDHRKRGYRYTDTSFQLPQIPVSQEEVLAILMARHLLSKTAGGCISDAIRSFGDKLLAQAANLGLDRMRVRDSFSAHWHGHSPVSARVFQSVCSALLDCRVLEITYCSPYSECVTLREVEPHHLRYYMGSWVMFARCRLRRDWRIFFLSRIQSLSKTEESFQPLPNGDWRTELDGAFGLYHGKARARVSLRFSPFRARFIREQVWHEDQAMEDLPDGGVRLSFNVADFDEVKEMVLRFGADVVVEEPEALRRLVVEEVAKMAAVYGGDA